MIFPMESYVNSEYTGLLNSFEHSLAESLKKLKPEDISDIWTLTWLSEAVNFLSETHNNIKILITDLELPISDWEAKWIDQYLDDSLKLLDICIAICSKLSQLEQGQIILKYALNNLNSSEHIGQAHTSLSDWMQKIESSSPTYEKCSAILQNLAISTVYSSKGKVSAKEKVLNRALYAVKSVTILVCNVFISVLYRLKNPFTTMVVPDKLIWARAFNDLQTEALREITEHNGVLKEVKAVENCIENLCTFNGYEEKEMEKDVSEMAKAVENLSHGLDCLSKQVEDFFDVVLTGRNALLCNLGIFEEEQTVEDGNVEE